MIEIHPSPTADSRTCDFSNVTKETLEQSSLQHIQDVRQGFEFFKKMMDAAAYAHDHDKLSGIDHFHSDFIGGFKETGWWDNHRKVNRHHLLQPDGVPEVVEAYGQDVTEQLKTIFGIESDEDRLLATADALAEAIDKLAEITHSLEAK